MKRLFSALCGLLLFSVAFAASPVADHSVSFRNGKLKILQLTDIHYYTDSLKSAESLKRIEQILDLEKPDMVIITGDVVLGDNYKKGWNEVSGLLISRQIPWGAVLGNHDGESETHTRGQIMDYIVPMDYSVMTPSPAGLSGHSNFIIPVKGADGKDAAVLYCFDSGDYSTADSLKGYGWIELDQIDWYKENSQRFTQQNGGKPLPSLAFFHIPLQEYWQMDQFKNSYIVGTVASEMVGTRGEGVCAGVLNTGMFATMRRAGDILCTFAGHDHNNDYIGMFDGIGLAYGHFSGSKTTYTDIGYGARVIELYEGARAFDTWIRMADGTQLNLVHFPTDLLQPANHK